MLRAIEPKDLSFEWDRVRAGLIEVKKATTDDWLPEDVYMAIRQGQAQLFMCEDEHGDYLGFVVLRLIHTFHGAEMLVWCAYAATSRALLREFLPQIKALAGRAGAQRVIFSSARPEWATAARRLGFTPQQVTYALTI